MDWLPISADSHITEPPNCYRDHIDPAFRERKSASKRIVSLRTSLAIPSSWTV